MTLIGQRLNRWTRRTAASLRAIAGKEDGVTAIEYGLIAAAIAVAIVLAVFAAGDATEELFEDTAAATGQANQ